MRKMMMIAVSALALAGLSACGQPATEEPAPAPEVVEPAAAPVPVSELIMSAKTASVEKGAVAGTLKVCATGEANTEGWTNVRLEAVPVTAPPADGIYEFDLKGDKPGGLVPQVITPVSAQQDWAAAPADVKGVRVKGAGGAVDAKLGGASACPK